MGGRTSANKTSMCSEIRGQLGCITKGVARSSGHGGTYIEQPGLARTTLFTERTFVRLVPFTARTKAEVVDTPITEHDALVHMAYTEQLRLDGYSAAVHHALERKPKVAKTEVIFKAGDLVQVYLPQ